MVTFNVLLKVTISGESQAVTSPQLPDVMATPLGASGLALVLAGTGFFSGFGFSPHSAGKIMLISLGEPVSTHQKKLSHGRSDSTAKYFRVKSRLCKLIQVNRF